MNLLRLLWVAAVVVSLPFASTNNTCMAFISSRIGLRVNPLFTTFYMYRELTPALQDFRSLGWRQQHRQYTIATIRKTMFASNAPRRRSPRLLALQNSTSSEQEDAKLKPTKKVQKAVKGAKKKSPAREEAVTEAPAKKRAARKSTKASQLKASPKKRVLQKIPEFLARTREEELKKENPALKWVMGIDEAGRGPLCGPVVAAAAIVPIDLEGVMDSKKIAKEDAREELYEQIVASPDVRWSVAVVDAPRIDEINILQATMEAMSMAATALVLDGDNAREKWQEATRLPASASRGGCYVVCGGNLPKSSAKEDKIEKFKSASDSYYALVDGNRVPKDLPCGGEAMVKGDLREYSIAAASILAKVTRDRLMHAYDEMYPGYNLATVRFVLVVQDYC